jgi:predicted SAM-dependent methyltransferase
MSLLREMLVFDTNRLLLWLLSKRRVRIERQRVCVNLGSGICPAPGWINLDSAWYSLGARWPRFLLRVLYRASSMRSQMTLNDYVTKLRANQYVFHNLEHSLPFNNLTVDFVYSSHTLEHLVTQSAQRVCREVLRVLKPGGVFRVCVPDLRIALDEYASGNREHALIMLFGTESPNYYGSHKWMYDADTLTRMLIDAGFRDVTLRTYREGDTPDLEYLDNREGETLRLEARKLQMGL